MADAPTTRVQLKDASGAYLGHADVELPTGSPHQMISVGSKTYLWDSRSDAYIEQADAAPKATMVKASDLPDKNPEAVHHTWLNPAGVAVKAEFGAMDPPPAVPPASMLDKDAKVQG